MDRSKVLVRTDEGLLIPEKDGAKSPKLTWKEYYNLQRSRPRDYTVLCDECRRPIAVPKRDRKVIDKGLCARCYARNNLIERMTSING